MYTKDGSNLVPVPSNAVIPERDINDMPALECKNLGITFGGLHAVENFNLTIGQIKTELRNGMRVELPSLSAYLTLPGNFASASPE